MILTEACGLGPNWEDLDKERKKETSAEAWTARPTSESMGEI